MHRSPLSVALRRECCLLACQTSRLLDGEGTEWTEFCLAQVTESIDAAPLAISALLSLSIESKDERKVALRRRVSPSAAIARAAVLFRDAMDDATISPLSSRTRSDG